LKQKLSDKTSTTIHRIIGRIREAVTPLRRARGNERATETLAEQSADYYTANGKNNCKRARVVYPISRDSSAAAHKI